jgi:hypothetical protein
MVGFVIVPVESSFSDSKRCFDSERIPGVKRRRCQVLINMVHGRNDRGDVGRATGEKECCVLKNLYKGVSWKGIVYCN